MNLDLDLKTATDLEISQAVISWITPKMGITKAVVSRSVKGARGDSFIGFSVQWRTVQDDSGGSVDLTSDDVPDNVMTLSEARLAVLVLGLQADMAAHANAVAGGNLSGEQFEEAKRAISSNYSKLIADRVRQTSPKAAK